MFPITKLASSTLKLLSTTSHRSTVLLSILEVAITAPPYSSGVFLTPRPKIKSKLVPMNVYERGSATCSNSCLVLQYERGKNRFYYSFLTM